MENTTQTPAVKLVVPTSGTSALGKKAVEFKTFKVYTPAEIEGSNDIWLGNISFTAETQEAGLFIMNKLIELGVLGSIVSADEEIKRNIPPLGKLQSAFANIGA